MFQKLANWCSREKWLLIAIFPILLFSVLSLLTPSYRLAINAKPPWSDSWLDYFLILILFGVLAGLMLLFIAKVLFGLFKRHTTSNALFFTIWMGASLGFFTEALINFLNITFDSSRTSYSNVLVIGSFMQPGSRGTGASYSGFVRVKPPNSQDEFAVQIAYHLPTQNFSPPEKVSFIYGSGFWVEVMCFAQ
jgi:hypothetical protein